MDARIASGVTDQVVYFQRQTGLTNFTVYRARNGATPAAMTTPTVVEDDSTNMPGIYNLLLDEDTALAAGNLTEAMALYITHSGMEPVFLNVELYATVTDANLVTVAGGGTIQASGSTTPGYAEA